jgi:galactose mutarotase-like enzyme
MPSLPPSLPFGDSSLQALELSTPDLAMQVVPGLGAKILSFVDRSGGSEWMWTPPDGRGLFRNAVTDSFAQSTLAGADECFPTVAACEWKGRRLPDHGELWAVPWQVLAHTSNSLELAVRAPISPFRIKRRIGLAGRTARFDYTVENTGDSAEEFLWAFHPLLNFGLGDYLEIPAKTARIDSQINTPFGSRGAAIALPEPAPAVRLDRMDFGPLGPAAVKYFTDALEEGRAALARPALGRRLVFEFDRAQLNTVGVWINTGGWSGYRHVAIEPTNGAPDSLVIAAAWNRCQRLAPGASLAWSMSLSFENL